jgi:pimeloyl-ACP methyl ester carboxylesterase
LRLRWFGVLFIVFVGILSQPVATLLHRLDAARWPSWIGKIASEHFWTICISWALFAVAIVWLIFVFSRRFEIQRETFVYVGEFSIRSVIRRWLANVKVKRKPVAKSARKFQQYAELAAFSYEGDRVNERNPPSGWTRIKCNTLEEESEEKGFFGVLLKRNNSDYAIVFRGTDEVKDVVSWAPIIAGTQYEIVERIWQRIISEIKTDAGKEKPAIVTVGHSLGGGLAKYFAYKARADVNDVYAFDSAPLLLKQKKESEMAPANVYNIHEGGEVLEYVRAVRDDTARFFEHVYNYRFNFTKSQDPIGSHSIANFADALGRLKKLAPPSDASPEDQSNQRELVYDYIKFHIGLYLATPGVMFLIAEAVSVEKTDEFLSSMVVMLSLYLVSGIHAGRFMGSTINRQWESDNLREFASRAYDPIRRFMHHWMYWAGLLVGITGIVLALVFNPVAKDRENGPVAATEEARSGALNRR